MDDTSKTNLLELISDREGQAALLANSGHNPNNKRRSKRSSTNTQNSTQSNSNSNNTPSKMVGKEIDVDEEMAKVKELAKMPYPPQQAAKTGATSAAATAASYPKQDSKQSAARTPSSSSTSRSRPAARAIRGRPTSSTQQRKGVVDVDALPRSMSPPNRFQGAAARRKPPKRTNSAPTAAAAVQRQGAPIRRAATNTEQNSRGNGVAPFRRAATNTEQSNNRNRRQSKHQAGAHKMTDESEFDILGLVAQRCNEVDCDECQADLEQGCMKAQKTKSLPAYPSQDGKIRATNGKIPATKPATRVSSRSDVAAKHARRSVRQQQQQQSLDRGTDHSRRSMISTDSSSSSSSEGNTKSESSTCKDACCSPDDLQEGSEVDLMRLVAQRIVDLNASDLESSTNSGSGSSDSGYLYDVEIGPPIKSKSSSGILKKAPPTRQSTAMTDMSALSMDNSDLKAVRTPQTNTASANGGGKARSPASQGLTAGAYSAAPGQGYVRNDNFAATSLRHPAQPAQVAVATLHPNNTTSTTTNSRTSSPPQEQHPGRIMEDGSTKSAKSTATLGASAATSLGPSAAFQAAAAAGAMNGIRSSATRGGATTNATAADNIISAVRVDEDDLELHIREQITSNAAQAQVVDMDKETETRMKSELEKVQRKYSYVAVFILLFLGLAVAAAAVTITQQNKKTNAAAAGAVVDDGPVFLSTLASITERGYLNCGLGYRGDDVNFHEDYQRAWEGFIGDICKALAAGVLGGNADSRLQLVNEEDRWKMLQRGELDVLIVGCPAITESLYFDVDTEVKASFSTSFLFDGVGVGGLPEYVENCATNTGGFRACRDMRVCVTQGSHALDVLEQRLHPSQIVAVPTLQDLYNRFSAGCCNMLATDFSNERAEVVVREFGGYEGDYALGAGLYSKQPYSGATRKIFEADLIEMFDGPLDDMARENDPRVWTEYVNWVINALFAAEQNNITQATAEYITQTDVFGERYRDVFHHAVAAAGNYGEIYSRTLGLTIPRDGMNLVNDGSTGLHYHHSLGSVNTFGTVNPDGTLDHVLKRGKLVCGIPAFQFHDANFTLGPGEIATFPPSRRLGNVTLHNVTHQYHEANALVGDMDHERGGASIDIEFCRAMSSSLFQGMHTSNTDTESCSLDTSSHHDESEDPTLEFVLLADEAEGYTKLQSGELDVIAGYRIDLQGDVREPTTGFGYSFTQPYFYGPADEPQHVTSNNRCMVTRQQDRQWSDFVHMVVMAIFYAEENHIDQDHANQMPAVNNFGPGLRRMFRDAVFAVGNYAEVYERLVEPFIPREGGPNTLNSEADPQLAALPGLI